MLERSLTYIARRKPVRLIARKVEREQTVETWEGPRQAHPGDYVMTGIKGEHWPVPASQFGDLYEIEDKMENGDLHVRKRVMELPVFQTYRVLDFEARGENFHAGVGYFIIRHPDNNMYPCEPLVFFKTFEIIREARQDEEFNLT